MIYISTGTQKDSCSSKASLCVELYFNMITIGVASASNTPTADEI
jgi:hypothetical protein